MREMFSDNEIHDQFDAMPPTNKFVPHLNINKRL